MGSAKCLYPYLLAGGVGGVCVCVFRGEGWTPSTDRKCSKIVTSNLPPRKEISNRQPPSKKNKRTRLQPQKKVAWKVVKIYTVTLGSSACTVSEPHITILWSVPCLLIGELEFKRSQYFRLWLWYFVFSEKDVTQTDAQSGMRVGCFRWLKAFPIHGAELILHKNDKSKLY